LGPVYVSATTATTAATTTIIMPIAKRKAGIAIVVAAAAVGHSCRRVVVPFVLYLQDTRTFAYLHT